MIEPWVITQEDSNVTQADTTANELQDLFKYRVPKGMKVHLRPTDIICFYGRETDNTALQANALVKLEMRDATGEEKTPLVNSIQYANYNGEFQGKNKLIKLDIGREIIVGEQEFISLMVKNPSPYADKDLSYFELRTHREI